jgi:D-mannonate dehydratase
MNDHAANTRTASRRLSFRETFQDNGDTDVVASMRAFKEIGFTGPVRPDHVPTLVGETNDNPGYEMLGRLWALGYIKVHVLSLVRCVSASCTTHGYCACVCGIVNIRD